MIGRMGWLFGQGMAAFAGGAVVATVASRLLPPLMAQATGAARAARGGDLLDTLITDHRRFIALLSEMEQSADSATFHRSQLLLRLKRGLAAHALAEEDIVYPLLHGDAKAVEDAKHLYSEHADIKIHLHALEEMLKLFRTPRPVGTGSVLIAVTKRSRAAQRNEHLRIAWRSTPAAVGS